MFSHSNRLKNIFEVITLILILSGMGITSHMLQNQSARPPIKIDKQDSTLNLSKEVVFFFNMGLRRLYSGLYWIVTLIESDLSHYKKSDLNSWIFHRFDILTDLDPKFLEAYQFGGVYLSVVKDDLKGSSYIFDKGLKEHPQDYFLNFNGAIHAFIETGEHQLAIDRFRVILKHPTAPKYLPSLIAKIKLKETNNVGLAFDLMKSSYDSTPEDSPMKNKFFLDCYALKAEIDLNCLNAKEKGCQRIDFEGKPYLVKNKKFYAQRPWKKFRSHRKKGPRKNEGP